ncbi:hypothetical protein Mycsm_00743 [Mycobacterium sp. JS623]|uniref:Rv1733c family protein n=1 Tax=Mycobacterium sp. JS623 TaxID=212767 RepID=UPI0002A58404|nr:hypothetical protein [Mycobacterium sp. JS623]AGB21184.1 hypothetical protein Mycsm_00743 [Mycobacterium sp. JS623]
MQWFTVAWWRWRLAQARGRNPLVRTSDRVEVAVMALAVLVSLIVMPFAGAIGTAIHDEHAKTYATQQHDRHQVAAPADKTAADKTATDKAAAPTGPAAVLQARWRAGDVENAGALDWANPTKDAAGADIWVDNNGRQVGPPAASWQAAADATVAAAGVWLAATTIAALAVALVRRGLRHARSNAWNREIATLVHDDGGRAGRHR